MAVVTLVYFSIGFGLSQEAFGGLYGTKNYLLIGEDSRGYSEFLLDFICCWQCVSIASAALCERAFIGTHVFLTVLVSGILFPVACSWIWGGGWLSELGFLD